MKTHNGKFSIIRNNHGEIKIELNDEKSGVRVVDITLTPEILGLALTGLGYQECSFTLYRPELVGKVREMKTVEVPVPEFDLVQKEETARATLLPYEVDGWKGEWRDVFNYHHHSYDKDGRRFARVTFIRYVDEKEETV